MSEISAVRRKTWEEFKSLKNIVDSNGFSKSYQNGRERMTLLT